MQSLLNKKQIAERFGTTAAIASRILSEKGINPIDLGRGRSRGLRWYSSAVDAIIFQMHKDAQAENKPTKKPYTRFCKPGLVVGRSINDLYSELTQGHKIQ